MHAIGPRRSSFAIRQRRVAQAWPADREFRILSIDGGGIRGVFSAMVLAELEGRFLGRGSIRDRFDLVTGTSTGGIIALGLGAGLSPRQMAQFYIEQGREIFPPYEDSIRGRLRRRFAAARKFTRYRYERDALERVLADVFADRKLGSSPVRLCIPSADGNHGDVYIFKTPHHPDYKLDQHELMTKVACATAAAPTFFQPLDDGGYRFIDGGLWANNPIMIGLVDALACFDVDRGNIRILSVGCGDTQFTVGEDKVEGGLLAWKDVIEGAMSFQSLNALGQARLLIGADRVVRIAPNHTDDPIQLDDWVRATSELPEQARRVVEERGAEIAAAFFEG